MATYTGRVLTQTLQASPSGAVRAQLSVQSTRSNATRKSLSLQRGADRFLTGGKGRVRGVVEVSPAFPVARMVYLYTEGDHLLYRAQMSDVHSGVFDFQGLPMGLTYMAVAIDHTGTYRAETHDRLTPELMA